MEIKPFIKWAGGKGSLINQLTKYYPIDLINGNIDTYIEPFLGGGAVLINILQEYHVKNVYAFDINADLINCYKVIQSNVEELIKDLYEKEKDFLKLDMEEKSKYFYKIRDSYNSYKLDEDINIRRAGEFIFLNRTCFNGLYRVNKKGDFNVPFGKYKNPTICNAANLRNLSKLIRNVTFVNGDYTKSEEYIKNNTFIYFDPPYRPLPNSNSFTSYDKSNFNDNDQKNLANYFSKLNDQNIKMMLSNSNPKNTNENDDFFVDIYKGFNINEVSAKRMINSDSSKRGAISELLITNHYGVNI